MTTFAVRIGRIKLRSGAEVHVHDFAERRRQESAEVLSDYRRHAGEVPDACPDMTGYVQIAWDREGWWSVGYRVSMHSPLREADIAQFVAERIRCATIESSTIRALHRPPRT